MLVVADDLQTQQEKALDSESISHEPRPLPRVAVLLLRLFVPSHAHSAPRIKIESIDAKLEALIQAQSASVEERSDQAISCKQSL